MRRIKLLFFSIGILAGGTILAQPSFNIPWDNVTLSDYSANATGVTYTLDATNSSGFFLLNSGTVTITFPVGTDASTFSSGTYDGSPISGTAVGNTITFPTSSLISNGTSFTVVLNDITNPPGGTYTLLSMACPNQHADFTTFDTTSYTIVSPAPVSEFIASSTSLCAGEGISFVDQTTNLPTSWSWSFPGGTPSSSTLQNPSSIKYFFPGTYDVVLTTSNGSGSSTETKVGHITVGSTDCGDLDQWTWITGDSVLNDTNIFECGLGCTSVTNTPNALNDLGKGAVDDDGNFWFFGGGPNTILPFNGGYNDLWKFTPGDNGSGCVNCWTRVSGDLTLDTDHTPTQPSGRRHTVLWYSNNKIYLFGGLGRGVSCQFGSGRLNNLWEYDIAGGVWTMLTGDANSCDQAIGTYGVQGTSNPALTPGARNGAEGWTDNEGNLWLFGGYGVDDGTVGCCGALNDLWKYNTTDGMWTWVSGSKLHNDPGNFGTMGVPSTANAPSARQEPSVVYDKENNIAWLFGGSGTLGRTNDLWKYDLATNEWTWVHGSNVSGGIPGSWGVFGVPDPANIPAPKRSCAEWMDAAGNLWVWGGDMGAPTAHDLWVFQPSLNEWMWVSGDSTVNGTGVYGIKGVPSPNNLPGARERSISWIDKKGGLWLFGGRGGSQSNFAGTLNSLWRYAPKDLSSYILLPVVDLGPDTTICANDSLVLKAGSGFDQYLWTTVNTDTTGIDSILTVRVADTVSVMVQDTFGNWSIPDTIIITTTLALNADITAAGPYCISQSSDTLEVATPGGTWSGTGITNVNEGIFDPAIAGAGTHEIIYTLTGSCANADTINIDVSSVLVPNITSDSSFCDSETNITLTADAPNGVWTGPGIVNSSTGLFDASAAGVGTHEITYAIQSSCGDSDKVNIAVSPSVDPTISPVSDFCITDSPITLTSANSGGIWTGNGITNSTSGDFDPNVAGIGTHTIVYSIVTSCVNIDSVEITVGALVDATITPADTMCESNPVIQFTAVDGGGTWTGNGILNGANGLFDASQAGAGTHTIIYTISDACTDEDTIEVVVAPALDATISTVPDLCIGDDFITLTAVDPGGAWSGVGITDPVAGSFDPTVAGVGSHEIIYSVMSFCSDTDTVNIVVNEAPNIQILSTQFCESDGISQLTANATGGVWKGNGVTDEAAGLFDPSLVGIGSSSIEYILTTTCGTDTSAEDIVVHAVPDISLNTTNETCLENEDGIVSVTVNVGELPYTYAWSNGSDTDSIFGLAPGNYSITFTDNNGCSTNDSTVVAASTEPCFVKHVYIPNIFSPDGDNINDILNAFGGGIETFKLSIFDRWGKKVFETEDIDTGWDGSFQGKPLNSGVFVYFMEGTFIDAEEFKESGNITLVR